MKNLLAITHVPSPYMEQCQLTHVPRTPIDYVRALQQHQEYCQVLRACGAEVRTLDSNRDLPDCVFVEDTAIVLDEVAVIASMGAESRRPETAAIELELEQYREIKRIELPATIDGGDVLRVGRTLFIGLSSRTNGAGVRALARIAGPFGYNVVPVRLRDCLHLKTACSALPDQTLLVNPAWLEWEALSGFTWIRVPKEEPWAADVLLAGEIVCVAAQQVRTAEMIRQRGFDVRTIDLSEFAKAEGGVTCLSILFLNPAS
jgi:dimethylargininase